MIKKKIFLSYRRADIPGYVGRLEDELERAFDPERIFRDVEDIVGGSEWKRVIDQNLIDSGAVILLIGPRWSEIWQERMDDPVNYVALELQRAKELGVAIIPVTLGKARISSTLDLGEIAWLREKQVYNISDRQGRWSSDVKGLIKVLENIPSIGPAFEQRPTEPDNVPIKEKKSSFIKPVAILSLLAIGGFLLFSGLNEPSDPDPEDNVDQTKVVITAPPATTLKADDEKEKSIAPVNPEPVSTPYPDISGTWVSRTDGTFYIIEQFSDGRFNITSPGWANGSGHFIENLPRKAKFEFEGIAYGEFSVSNTNQSISSWGIYDGTSEKIYDTLVKAN